jgi:hypothetical protein
MKAIAMASTLGQKRFSISKAPLFYPGFPLANDSPR